MSYTITISKTETVVKTVGKEWKIVGQRTEIPKTDAMSHIDKIDVKPCDVYDYTPEIEKTVDVTTEILKQTVDDIDLPAVIKAINKL